MKGHNNRRIVKSLLDRNERKKARIRICVVSAFTIIALLLLPLMIIEYNETSECMLATANESEESENDTEDTEIPEETEPEDTGPTDDDTDPDDDTDNQEDPDAEDPDAEDSDAEDADTEDPDAEDTETEGADTEDTNSEGTDSEGMDSTDTETEIESLETEDKETMHSEIERADIDITDLMMSMSEVNRKGYKLYWYTNNLIVEDNANYASLRDVMTAIGKSTSNRFYIHVLGDDPDMASGGDTEIRVPIGKTITISSKHPRAEEVGTVWTLKTTKAIRHFHVVGTLILDNIILDGAKTGGGVRVGYIGIDHNRGELIMNSGSIIRNCVSTDIVIESRRGGGVYVEIGDMTMNGGSIITRNYASRTAAHHGYGGGVYLQGSSTLTMNAGSTISYNTATDVHTGGRDGAGGGVFLNQTGWGNSSMIMNGGSINNNVASTSLTLAANSYITGGGVYISQGCTVEMRGSSEINENTAGTKRRGNGGGVYIIDAGKLTMRDNSKINNNRASTAPDSSSASGTSNSGGVHVFRDGIFEMHSGTIRDNIGATGTGAPADGGGVNVIDHGVFTMHGGTISGNTASTSGAGIGGGVAVSENSNFVMRGGTISDNYASRSGSGTGGGVGVSSGTFTMEKNSSGIISGNNATNGGGVAVSGGTFTMEKNSSGIISGNDATTGNGGGIYLASTGKANLEGGQISGNNAPKGHGGGIYTYNSNHNTLTVSADVAFGNHSGTPTPNTALVKVNLEDYSDIQLDYKGWYPTISSPYGQFYSTESNHPVNNYDINVAVYIVTEKHVDIFGKELMPAVSDKLVPIPNVVGQYLGEAQDVPYHIPMGYKWDTAPDSTGKDFISNDTNTVDSKINSDKVIYFVYMLDIPPMGVSPGSSSSLIIPLLLAVVLIPVGFKIIGLIKKKG